MIHFKNEEKRGEFFLDKKSPIAIVGAGSWGSALAVVLADNGFKVDLLTRTKEHADEINSERTNKKYLPGISFSTNIVANNEIEEVLKNKQQIILAVPSHAMRETAESIKPYLTNETIITHATKGLEIASHKRMSEVILEALPAISRDRVLVLSGPSHAEEVSRRLPTTVVIAGTDLGYAEQVQGLFINNNFRVYTNLDLIGVEIAGALKNIIALGAGLSDGLAFGDNAKAALLTRGLAEITRLGVEMGASPLTFSGLAGVGDLVVTCTSKHSRNWRAGYMLGKGTPLEEVLENMGMVVEGVKTTKAAFFLAKDTGVEMPIAAELYQVLFENKSPQNAVNDLMGRVKTRELESFQ